MFRHSFWIKMLLLGFLRLNLKLYLLVCGLAEVLLIFDHACAGLFIRLVGGWVCRCVDVWVGVFFVSFFFWEKLEGFFVFFFLMSLAITGIDFFFLFVSVPTSQK